MVKKCHDKNTAQFSRAHRRNASARNIVRQDYPILSTEYLESHPEVQRLPGMHTPTDLLGEIGGCAVYPIARAREGADDGARRAIGHGDADQPRQGGRVRCPLQVCLNRERVQALSVFIRVVLHMTVATTAVAARISAPGYASGTTIRAKRGTCPDRKGMYERKEAVTVSTGMNQ